MTYGLQTLEPLSQVADNTGFMKAHSAAPPKATADDSDFESFLMCWNFLSPAARVVIIRVFISEIG